MNCITIDESLCQISLYFEQENSGIPLIINTENFEDYHAVFVRLSHAIKDKNENVLSFQNSLALPVFKIIKLSDYAQEGKLPLVETLLEEITHEGKYLVLGLSQFFMLQGEKALNNFIIETLSLRQLKGKVVFLMCMCSSYLRSNLSKDKRLINQIIFIKGHRGFLPELRFIKYKEFADGEYCTGLQEIIRSLENLKEDGGQVTVFIHYTPQIFRDSLFSIKIIEDVFDELLKKYPNLSKSFSRTLGTEKEWLYLFSEMKKYKNFSELVLRKFGGVENFLRIIPEIYARNFELEKWLLWISMKILYKTQNDYLYYVLTRTQNYTEFVHEVFVGILSIADSNFNFENYFAKRRDLMKNLPENLNEISSFIEESKRLGKLNAYYLTDIYEDERYEFMKLMSHCDVTEDKIYEAIRHSSPELDLYIRDFNFNENNTQLRKQDAEFRKTLSRYFHKYKLQKLHNKLETEFINEVERLAVERPFYKLQLRSSLLSEFKTPGTQAYFFDALGVEFLGYIEAKSEIYGLKCDVKICRCNLPSITSCNKEFLQEFDAKSISALDELKHHGVRYNYKLTSLPVYIYDELKIIDYELRKISAELINGKISRALIISDHGASRPAVLYNQETTKRITVHTNGEIAARFCACNKPSKLENTVYDSGYCVSSNYNLFQGSRRSTIEMHGGASLEEVVIPLISLSINNTSE